MLNFLNTAVLIAAVAALLPFLLHLFSKRKVKIIPFSSITYLKAMQKRQVRAIKIKQLLLLVIRTLIILALVLAFARPATRGGYLGSHASVSAVVIVDNSASMGLSVKDGRLFDLGVRKAREIIEQMGQADEVALLTTVGEARTGDVEALFGNPAAAMDILLSLSLTDGRSNISDVYERAAGLLAERQNLNREMYIISDFQRNAITMEETNNSTDDRVYLVDLPIDEIDNAGIVDVDFGNQLIEVGTEFTISAAIKKRSGATDDMLVSLYVDNKRVSQQNLQLRPGESRAVPFTLTVSEPGYHSGYIGLSDDDFLADNVYHFSFYIPDQFTVLMVGEGGMDSYVVKTALAPEENIRRHWSVKQVGYNQFPTVKLADYDVVLLINSRTLQGGDIARLKEFVRRGGGLLVNIGKDTDSAQYNNEFIDMTGLELTSSFPRQFSRSGYFLMSDFDFEHQILSIFRNVSEETKPAFKAYAMTRARLAGDINPDILARWSDGSPAVTVSAYERGRVMVLNGDLTPDISDISLHPFFVPFVVRSIEFLSSDFSSFSESVAAGSTPERVLRGGFNVRNEYTLVMPDSVRRTVTARFENDVYTVNCGRLGQAGMYSIFNGNRESDRFAVNIDPDEGDLYRDDLQEIEPYFGNAEPLPYVVSAAGFIGEKRFGRELWKYFLLAALVLLLLEMYIARDRGAVTTPD